MSGIRTHDFSVRTSEDISCLIPRGHCDRLKKSTMALQPFCWILAALQFLNPIHSR
jgi:hypothetical protein